MCSRAACEPALPLLARIRILWASLWQEFSFPFPVNRRRITIQRLGTKCILHDNISQFEIATFQVSKRCMTTWLYSNTFPSISALKLEATIASPKCVLPQTVNMYTSNYKHTCANNRAIITLLCNLLLSLSRSWRCLISLHWKQAQFFHLFYFCRVSHFMAVANNSLDPYRWALGGFKYLVLINNLSWVLKEAKNNRS